MPADNWSHCERKRGWYATSLEAKVALQEFQDRLITNGDPEWRLLRVYKCSYQKHWHVGRKRHGKHRTG